VIIGERPAKLLTMGMMVAFYPILLGLVLAGLVGPWVLVVVLALPRLAFVLGIFRKPRPEAPPPDYPIWPLWFVGAAMIHTRLAGSFLVLGLIVNIVVPVTLPWLA
jgi:1,4-dihydroxy-2-naphthoate octaprenyltransferase